MRRASRPKQSNTEPLYTWRYLLILFLLICVAGIIIWRMIDLNVIQRKFLMDQSDARILRNVQIPAHRGMIVDSTGAPLAISAPVYDVWIDPQMFQASGVEIAKLASILNISPSVIYRQNNPAHDRQFAYIERQVTPAVARQVRDLKLKGLFFNKAYKSYYPEGSAAAQVIGFTNIDGKGIAGLELAFNDWLRGAPGLEEVVKDRLGHTIGVVKIMKKPEQGHNLVLSLNHRIQYLAYEVLKNAVQKNNAKSGSVVVMDVKTGEILAMANSPSFNPNLMPPDTDGRYRNRAVTDVFEPGSVMKAISISAALASGKYTPSTIIDTSPGWVVIDGATFNDDGDFGVIDVTQVVEKSSNVGVAKITLSLPPQNLWHWLQKMGFGERTSSGFPGEADGSLLMHRIWRPIDLATLSFGYGVSVTTLQLAHAYSIIANGGVKLPVTFLKLNQIPPGERVMSEQLSQEMIKILRSVLRPNGTGWLARVPGYTVAGKTGTAYIAGLHGYNKHRYNATFVGIAPATDPQLVVVVAIHDPRGGKHFGGDVSAPAFSKIMGGALRILNIPPDDLPTENNKAGNQNG